jgi:hypothetical protein
MSYSGPEELLYNWASLIAHLWFLRKAYAKKRYFLLRANFKEMKQPANWEDSFQSSDGR